jgi:hypothetical protein
MDEMKKEVSKSEHPEYDAPRIEEVMTPSDLEREAQYAGTPISQRFA